MMFTPFLNKHLENFLHHINNLHHNIMEGESNETSISLYFIEMPYGKISLLAYRMRTHTDNSDTTALTNKQTAIKMFFPPWLIEHIPLSPLKVT